MAIHLPTMAHPLPPGSPDLDPSGRPGPPAERDIQVRALAARVRALEGLLDVTAELVCATGPDGRITYVNRAWSDTLGYGAAEAALLRPVDLVAPEHRTRYLETARDLVAGVAVPDFEAVLLARDGRRVACRGHAVPVLVETPDGPRCVGTRAAYRDVTAAREAEAQRAQLVAMLDASPDVVGTVAPDGTVAYLNAAGRRLLGVAPATDLRRMRAEDYHAPATRERLHTEALPAAVRDGRWVGDGTLVGAGGAEIPVSVAVVAHPAPEAGGPPSFSAVMRDLRERVAAEAALQVSTARFRAVFDGAAVGISILDDAGTILQANAALEAFLGYGPGELLGRYAPDLSPPEDRAVTRGPVADLRAGTRESAAVEKRFVHRDGAVRWAALTLSRLPLGDGRWGTLGVVSDVTERRALEARLAALSEHDELTGLLNRRGFARMAAQELKVAGRTRRHDALLALDLDHLKPINDTHGHAAGDAALRGVAEVIRTTVRDADFGARLGGDEFVVYAVGLRPGDGQIVAARLRANLAAHNAAAAADRPFQIAFSVGVAELAPGDSVDALLARGDAALYAQKAARRT